MVLLLGNDGGFELPGGNTTLEKDIQLAESPNYNYIA